MRLRNTLRSIETVWYLRYDKSRGSAMTTDMKRRKLLRTLARRGETHLLVDLQPRGAEHFYLSKDNLSQTSGRFPPSHLPFRRPNTALVSYHGSRIIGHIYGLNEKMEIVINRRRSRQAGEEGVSLTKSLPCGLEMKEICRLQQLEKLKE